MTARPDTIALYPRPLSVNAPSDEPTTTEGYRALVDQLRRDLRRRDAQIEALQTTTERRIRVYSVLNDRDVTVGELTRTMEALTHAGCTDVALRPHYYEGHFAGLNLVASNVTSIPASAA